MNDLNIAQGLSIAALLWPDFIEVEGAILIGPLSDAYYDRQQVLHARDLTEAESSINHTHIFDCFQHDASLPDGNETGRFWDSEHPDFKMACELAKLIAHVWAHKLASEFPHDDFRVYYTQEDNPIVRFHKVRPEEGNWLSEEKWQDDITQGKIVIVSTAELRRRIGGGRS